MRARRAPEPPSRREPERLAPQLVRVCGPGQGLGARQLGYRLVQRRGGGLSSTARVLVEELRALRLGEPTKKG